MKGKKGAHYKALTKVRRTESLIYKQYIRLEVVIHGLNKCARLCSVQEFLLPFACVKGFRCHIT